MRKIVLSGGPHTGKTTLMEALRQRLADDAYFVPEPAESIIKAELRKEEDRPDYKAILPTTRYVEFAALVIARSVELESQIPAGTKTVILDRSLIDNIGYARLNGCEHLVPNIQRLIKTARYSAVLFCDFVGEYTQTDVRPESWEFARSIHSHLQSAYSEAEIEYVQLPAVALNDRLEMIMNVIQSPGPAV